MKKGKLLFLLLAILSLALILSACNESQVAENENGKGHNCEQDGATHEMLNYFELKNEIEGVSFSEISRIEGEVVQIDNDNNLLSVKNKDLDAKNDITETVSVYDITTGTKIFEKSVTYPLYASGDDVVTLEVEIDYPIIRASVTTYEEDSEKPLYDVSYYFAKENGAEIAKTNKSRYSRTDFENGLVAYDMGDDTYWINNDMEIVRSVASIAANGYEIDVFNSEYNDYVYAWTDSYLQVFDPDGLCCAEYKIDCDGEIYAHVLNNGNVLVQKFCEVDDTKDFDVMIEGDRYTIESFIITFTDGTYTPIELDFIVDELETNYCESYGDDYTLFPFEITDKVDNQAFIYKIVNKSVVRDADYVALDNDMNVLYTVKNSTEGRIYYDAEVICSELYRMYVCEGGTYQEYIFDLDGNKISATSSYAMATDNYIISESAIYNHNLELVYDIATNGFEIEGVDAYNEKFFFTKHNFTTGKEEIYVFNAEKCKAELFVDGDETTLTDVGYGYYITCETETDKNSFCGPDGNVILITLGEPNVYECEDAFVVTGIFEGKTLVYVIK